jgi:hypothetical protein
MYRTQYYGFPAIAADNFGETDQKKFSIQLYIPRSYVERDKSQAGPKEK